MTAFRLEQLRNMRHTMMRSASQFGVAAIAVAVLFAATAADVPAQIRALRGLPYRTQTYGTAMGYALAAGGYGLPHYTAYSNPYPGYIGTAPTSYRSYEREKPGYPRDESRPSTAVDSLTRALNNPTV